MRRGRHFVGSRKGPSRIFCYVFLASVGFAGLTPALATDTVSYVYDAQGRLVQVTHSGTAPNNGVSASYAYDRAGNRTSVVVSTAPPCSGVNFTVSSNGAVIEGATSSFTVTKHGTAAGSCAVNYATANGTAVAPGDYSAASGTLVFTTAQTSQTVNVTTIDDATSESAETFSLALSSPTNGATLGTPASATATINDNDGSGGVTLSISNSQANEGNPLVFEVTKSGTATGTVTVHYGTVDGTAVAPGDYTATSGTLSFAVTDTVKTITVATSTDARVESNETMDVGLSAPTGGATITDGDGVGTIFDVGTGGGGGGCGRGCLQPNGSTTSDPSTTTTDSTSPAPASTPPPDPTTPTDPPSTGE
jgi:hypothetical protein